MSAWSVWLAGEQPGTENNSGLYCLVAEADQLFTPAGACRVAASGGSLGQSKWPKSAGGLER